MVLRDQDERIINGPHLFLEHVRSCSTSHNSKPVPSELHDGSTSSKYDDETKPRSKSKKLRKRALALDYQPGKYAVLCGRGKMCTLSTGNSFLKSTVKKYLGNYSRAANKTEKSMLVSAIVDFVHTLPGGKFIRYHEGQWWEVDRAFGREKIGSLFRDALFMQYRSSTTAKTMRKKARNQQNVDGVIDIEPQPVVSNGMNPNTNPFVDLTRTPQAELPIKVPPTEAPSKFFPPALPSLHGFRQVSVSPSTVPLQETQLIGSCSSGMWYDVPEIDSQARQPLDDVTEASDLAGFFFDEFYWAT